MYPGLGAKWKDGTTVKGQMPILKNGELKIEFFSNVLNERWSPSNGGYIENEYRQELIDDIKKLTGIGVVG